MTRRTKRRTQISGQFVPRTREMIESPAFRVLSLAGHRVLARLEIELCQHGGGDNGNLPVTFDDFEWYGIHRHAIAPALREVEALGFIEVTERGRAGNAEFRKPSRYRLTYRHTDKAGATDEWKRIADESEAVHVPGNARGRLPKKQNSSGEIRQISVAESALKTGNP